MSHFQKLVQTLKQEIGPKQDEMEAPLPSDGAKQEPHATHSPSPTPTAVHQEPANYQQQMPIPQAWAPTPTVKELAMHFHAQAAALEQDYQWQLAMAHERIAYLEHLLAHSQAHSLCAMCGATLL
jgi:hypothetical protein